MALNALVDSFLPQSEKNVEMKGLSRRPTVLPTLPTLYVTGTDR